MNSIVCTLFERNYHFGVAALVNSLYKNGFRGNFYAGYRGDLPLWVTKDAEKSINLKWEGATTLNVEEGLNIHFLPLNTEYHLTNYKPDFMLLLLDMLEHKADNIFYFDPDIVIKCRWSFFESWVEFGVCLIHEITSSDMPPTHPIRKMWEKVILNNDLSIQRKLFSYINGGFCGVSIRDKKFIEIWTKIIKYAFYDSQYNPHIFMSLDRTFPFTFIDQDALNITAMCYEKNISEMGPEGMDFTYGGWLMSHSVGNPKPWSKNFILESLKGNPPSLADKQFWTYGTGIINIYSSFYLSVKNIELKLTAFLGRFYKRN